MGSASGSYHHQRLQWRHAHAVCAFEFGGRKLVQAFHRVAHDRQQRVQEKRNQRRRFTHAQRHHGERDDRERRNRRDDIKDLQHGIAKPAQRPPRERDAHQHTDDDRGTTRKDNEQDVLARQVNHFHPVLEDSVDAARSHRGRRHDSDRGDSEAKTNLPRGHWTTLRADALRGRPLGRTCGPLGRPGGHTGLPSALRASGQIRARERPFALMSAPRAARRRPAGRALRKGAPSRRRCRPR